MVLAPGDGLLHGLDDEVRGRQIRVSHAQINNVHASGLDLVLDPVNFAEKIRRQFGQAIGRLEMRHRYSLMNLIVFENAAGFRALQHVPQRL